MRNLFTLVGAAVVVFGAVGWYLGWFQIQTDKTSTGHRTINIDVNTKKIAEDVKKGEQKVEQAISHTNPGQNAPQNGVTIVPNVPTSNPPQPVLQGNGILTGLKVNGDGSVTLPPLIPQTTPPPQ